MFEKITMFLLSWRGNIITAFIGVIITNIIQRQEILDYGLGFYGTLAFNLISVIFWFIIYRIYSYIWLLIIKRIDGKTW